MKPDAYDHRILAVLRYDGRLGNIQLAEETDLSLSPCLHRMRLLEETGVIRGYQTSTDRGEVGLDPMVFVGVRAGRRPRPSTVRWSVCRR